MTDRPLRIGILGGTFDPIHVGHLIIAEEVRTRLGLSQVVFVPAGLPPHKRGWAIAAPEHRLQMIKLAIAGNPHFSLSRLDIDRSGPSFTVDTVHLLLDAWGADAEIYFIMGSDSLAELPTWHQPERLMRLCHIVAVGRPGYRVDLTELNRLLPGATTLIRMMDTPALDVSSTDIKRRVREGRSIRYLVPRAVERYIQEHSLYAVPR
jgi:nicotinate-nucleotide adenylyltransferase